MEEFWNGVDDFNDYEVSNYGRVRRVGAHVDLSHYAVTGGAMCVTLHDEAGRHTRSVKVLVALAFVECPEGDSNPVDFDTPVLLDNDQTNLRADNIVWRPRWFALQYRRQFNIPWQLYPRPIYCHQTNETFESIMHASMHHGMLFRNIANQLGDTQGPVFPHWYTFEYL